KRRRAHGRGRAGLSGRQPRARPADEASGPDDEADLLDRLRRRGPEDGLSGQPAGRPDLQLPQPRRRAAHVALEGGVLSNEVELKVAVFPGDGIGIEVMDSALAALEAVQAKVGGFRLAARKLEAGANCYKARGTALPDESIRAAEEADAILLGACGLPDV